MIYIGYTLLRSQTLGLIKTRNFSVQKRQKEASTPVFLQAVYKQFTRSFLSAAEKLNQYDKIILLTIY